MVKKGFFIYSPNKYMYEINLGENMNKMLLLFDYFKCAFRINIKSKIIYKIQIILAFFSALSVFIYGMLALSHFKKIGTSGFRFDVSFIPALIEFIVPALLTALVFLIIREAFRAGLYNMYNKAVNSSEELCDNDFYEGIGRYFLKFLGIDIVFALGIFILLIPIFILGIFSFGVGFVIIPLFFHAYLMMWKTSCVHDNIGVIESSKNSLKFFGKQAIPISVFFLMMFAFTSPINSSGYNNISEVKNLFNQEQENKENTFPNINDIEKNLIPNIEQKQINNGNFNILNILRLDKSTLFEKKSYAEGLGSIDEGEMLYGKNPLIPGINSLQSKTEEIKNFFIEKPERIQTAVICLLSFFTLGKFIHSVILMFFTVFFELALFVIFKEKFGDGVDKEGVEQSHELV